MDLGPEDPLLVYPRRICSQNPGDVSSPIPNSPSLVEFSYSVHVGVLFPHVLQRAESFSCIVCNHTLVGRM